MTTIAADLGAELRSRVGDGQAAGSEGVGPAESTLAQPLAERVAASLRVLEDLESALGRRQLLDAAPDLAAAAGDPAAVLDLGFVPEEVGCRWGGECSV